ncbi:MAG: FHA domain-containing protein [Methylococcaceae bacterium]
MNIKFPAGIGLSIFLFCTSAFAEQLQVGSIYTDQKDEVSFIITLPEGIDTTPKASDFQLLDEANNVLRQEADEIKSFKESSRGFDLLICLDVSGSIQKTLPGIRNALIDFDKLKLTRKEDKFGIVSFADKVTIESDFTDDIVALKKTIRKLKSQGKQTLLYRAIFDSLNTLNKDKFAVYRRILVISDGKDEGSDKSADDVINLSRKYGIPIDAIAQGVIPKQYSESLGRLADATGGQFIPQTTNLKDAIIQIHKNFIENTWVVYFRYKSDTEKPPLKNAVLKFKKNDSLTLSAAISKDIPMPIRETGNPVVIETTPQPPVKKADTDETVKWKELFPYFGLGLISAILLFIFWKYYQRNKHQTIATCGDTDITKKPVEPGPKPDTQQPKEPKPRQTEVITAFKVLQKSQNQTKLTLVVLEGPLKGQKIPINKQLFRIGANLDNDLVLHDDDYISGNHAVLNYENGQLFLSDQHSLNGTLLNSELVKGGAAKVLPGDVIQIGKSSLKLIEN